MITMELQIDGIDPNDGNKFKIKSMVESIAGVVRAHFPHHSYTVDYSDFLEEEVRAHTLNFGPHKR